MLAQLELGVDPLLERVQAQVGQAALGGLGEGLVAKLGKRLFAGFSGSLELEHLGARQSQYATFIDYRVKRR